MLSGQELIICLIPIPYVLCLVGFVCFCFFALVAFPKFIMIEETVTIRHVLPCSAANPWIIFKSQYYLEMVLVLFWLLEQWAGSPKHPVNLADGDEGLARQSP